MEITLSENIPEWLPMFGKKVRVFYHGMMRQCNGCFGLGHLKWECKNPKANWRGYVASLKATARFEDQLLGSWLEVKEAKEDPKKTDEKNAEGAEKGKGENKKGEKDLRELLNDPSQLRKALESFVSKNKRRSPSRRSSRSPRRRSRSRSRSRSPRRGGRNQRYNQRGRNQGRRDNRRDNNRKKN